MQAGGQGRLHLGWINKVAQDKTEPDGGQLLWTCTTQRVEGKSEYAFKT